MFRVKRMQKLPANWEAPAGYELEQAALVMQNGGSRFDCHNIVKDKSLSEIRFPKCLQCFLCCCCH